MGNIRQEIKKIIKDTGVYLKKYKSYEEVIKLRNKDRDNVNMTFFSYLNYNFLFLSVKDEPVTEKEQAALELYINDIMIECQFIKKHYDKIHDEKEIGFDGLFAISGEVVNISLLEGELLIKEEQVFITDKLFNDFKIFETEVASDKNNSGLIIRVDYGKDLVEIDTSEVRDILDKTNDLIRICKYGYASKDMKDIEPHIVRTEEIWEEANNINTFKEDNQFGLEDIIYNQDDKFGDIGWYLVIHDIDRGANSYYKV